MNKCDLTAIDVSMHSSQMPGRWSLSIAAHLLKVGVGGWVLSEASHACWCQSAWHGVRVDGGGRFMALTGGIPALFTLLKMTRQVSSAAP